MTDQTAPRRELYVDDLPTNWQVRNQVELQTALALARASTQALLELSPLAHREMSAALAIQVARLEALSDPLSLAAANAIKPYLAKAA